MSNESNWAGNIGAQSPQNTQQDFLKQGMSGSQAAEAAAAAERARQAAQQKKD